MDHWARRFSAPDDPLRFKFKGINDKSTWNVSMNVWKNVECQDENRFLFFSTTTTTKKKRVSGRRKMRPPLTSLESLAEGGRASRRFDETFLPAVVSTRYLTNANGRKLSVLIQCFSVTTVFVEWPIQNFFRAHSTAPRCNGGNVMSRVVTFRPADEIHLKSIESNNVLTSIFLKENTHKSPWWDLMVSSAIFFKMSMKDE